MLYDSERVQRNVQKATTEDLLNRITAYRAGMEPEALAIIEEELRRRDVTLEQIEEHAEAVRRDSLFLEDGTAAKCSFCHNPAVGEGRGWYRAWGVIPVIPRRLRFCREHLPKNRMKEEG